MMDYGAEQVFYNALTYSDDEDRYYFAFNDRRYVMDRLSFEMMIGQIVLNCENVAVYRAKKQVEDRESASRTASDADKYVRLYKQWR